MILGDRINRIRCLFTKESEGVAGSGMTPNFLGRVTGKLGWG